MSLVKTVCLDCDFIFMGDWLNTENKNLKFRLPPNCPKCKGRDCELWEYIERQEILNSPEVMEAINNYRERKKKEAEGGEK